MDELELVEYESEDGEVVLVDEATGDEYVYCDDADAEVFVDADE